MSSPPSTYILKQLLGTAAPTPVINPNPHNRTTHNDGDGNVLHLPPLPPTFVEDCEDLVKLYGDGILGIGKQHSDIPLTHPSTLTNSHSTALPHPSSLNQDIA